MKRFFCYFLFLLFANIAYPEQGENISMKYSDITVSLEINNSLLSSFVTVTFTNNSELNDCKIPKWFLAEGGLDYDLFEIIDLRNNKIKYIGKYVKRGKITEKDLFNIKPKESVSTQIRLNDYYKLPLLRKNLRIRFFVLYELKSNYVSFK